MSGIIKRTVFADTSKGYFNFHDVAMVLTSLGPMLEPFVMNRTNLNAGQLIGFDPADMMARVDEIQEWPMGKEKQFFNDEGTNIHGYHLRPRVGY